MPDDIKDDSIPVVAVGVPVDASGCPEKPMDCYAQCRAKDKEILKQCRELNKEHVKKMREIGCTGTKCSTANNWKTCSKVTAKKKKKAAPRKRKTKRKAPVRRSTRRRKKSCGCRAACNC